MSPGPELDPGIQFGIDLPQAVSPSTASVASIRSFAAEAERDGYAACWAMDRSLASVQGLSPLPLLAIAATATDSLLLGTAVLLPIYWNPIVLANELLTLSQVTGGRLLIGLGLGERRLPGGPNGLSVPRAPLLEDTVRAVMDAWAASSRSTAAEPRDDDALSSRTAWAPPLWFGGTSKPALARAVKLGQGWIGSGALTFSEFSGRVALVRQLLRGIGASETGFMIARRLFVVISEREDVAASKAREFFGSMYSNPQLADDASVAGDQDHCLERLRRTIEAGARHIILHPIEAASSHRKALTEVVRTIREEKRGGSRA